ncbi:chaplin [Streptomyces spinoverrucosus]|uniref:chaplin n=1 Tax=Streptomyces spinoverrucosus TaxID=284043 RepID=UPI0027D9F1B0|nr:chaplin [Streptomyces spinoverrucosus]
MFAVAASGAMAMALPACAALAADGADAKAAAAGSPGLVSGNAIQLPVHLPVNICGNTVNVVGLLNPAAGNTCANKSKADGKKATGAKADSTKDSGGSATSGGASAQAHTADSPGLISGNGIQLPIDLPVNVSGNTVDLGGLGNPVFGNQSVNGPGDEPDQTTTPPVKNTPTPQAPEPQAPKPRAPKPPTHVQSQPDPRTPDLTSPTLAHTGADLMAPAVAGSTALLLTGTVLYRRFRPVRTR